MRMTIAEKILARASDRDGVKPGDYITAQIDTFMCHEAFAAVYLNLTSAGISKLAHPGKAFVFLDHYVPAPTQRAASIQQIVRTGVEKLGISNFYGERGGIAHQVMMEKGHVLPGNLIVGTDSHTCTYGALGAASSGIGISEMAYALATGHLWFRVPETIRFILEGELQPSVTSKDIILKIAGDYSAEAAQYKSVEFTGSAVKEMSIDSRMTISNMSVEIGAKFGIFETDKTSEDYFKVALPGGMERICSDPGADFEKTYEIDVSGIEPQVAVPHTVDNVKPASTLAKVKIDQAIVGSCTNGRLEDLEAAAHILKGKQVHKRVRMLVIPASWEIYLKAAQKGILSVLIQAGAIILNPGCGPCFGSYGGLLAPGERCISSTNRNFKGRMGSDRAEVYLASPATVAASALTGKITDPRRISG
ncbi:MAG: 3-isopropylmalate dehydratase large subunit [Pseudomonadota bacterium]